MNNEFAKVARINRNLFRHIQGALWLLLSFRSIRNSFEQFLYTSIFWWSWGRRLSCSSKRHLKFSHSSKRLFKFSYSSKKHLPIRTKFMVCTGCSWTLNKVRNTRGTGYCSHIIFLLIGFLTILFSDWIYLWDGTCWTCSALGLVNDEASGEG